MRGGKFQKAEGAKEEPGETDAPPSYAAYRRVYHKEARYTKKNMRGGAVGAVCADASRDKLPLSLL